MAETEQQIDVGGPWTDAVQRGERGVRLIGSHGGKRIEIDRALVDRGGDCLDGPDLRLRQSDARKLGGARAPDRASW